MSVVGNWQKIALYPFAVATLSVTATIRAGLLTVGIEGIEVVEVGQSESRPRQGRTDVGDTIVGRLGSMDVGSNPVIDESAGIPEPG